MGCSRRQVLSWVAVGGLTGVSGCSRVWGNSQDEDWRGRDIVESMSRSEREEQGRFFVTLGGTGGELSVNEKAGLRVESVTLARDTSRSACPDWNIVIKVKNTTSSRIELDSLSVAVLDGTGTQVVSQRFNADESGGDIPVGVRAGGFVWEHYHSQLLDATNRTDFRGTGSPKFNTNPNSPSSSWLLFVRKPAAFLERVPPVFGLSGA